MTKFGYARISTAEQNEARQFIALEGQDIPSERIYLDKLSGKNFNRPAYKSMLEAMQEGDVLFVKSIDRLGRNYEDIKEQWRILTHVMRVDVVVLDIPLLDTRNCKDLMGTFLSDLFLQILSYFAQNEREAINQRQAEGIVAAKARGVKFGRPAKELPENFDDIAKLWDKGKITTAEALEQTGLKKTTFYRRFREWKGINKKK